MAEAKARIWSWLPYVCRVVYKAFIFYTNVIFTSLFIIEAFIKIAGLGPKWFRLPSIPGGNVTKFALKLIA